MCAAPSTMAASTTVPRPVARACTLPASSLGQRAVLAPARHAAIDQARVEGLAGFGSQAQTLHGAGPHAFDQRIGIAHQGEHQVTPFG